MIIVLLAFFGIADASYIAQSESSGTPLLCNIENLSGCNIVVASPYSTLFGFSVAEYGVVFYSIIFALAVLELLMFNKFLRRVLQVLSLAGVVVSFFFILLQIFIIKAFCIYCSVSSFISLLIFISAILIEPLPERMQKLIRHKSPQSLSMPPAP